MSDDKYKDWTDKTKGWTEWVQKWEQANEQERARKSEAAPASVTSAPQPIKEVTT